MKEQLQKLTKIINEVMDINHSIALLDWDQQVYMPSGGAEDRGFMMGTLGKLAHEKFTSDEVGILLDELRKYLPELDPDGEDYRIISVTARDFEKNVCVPSDYVMERAKITSLAQRAWKEARAKSDFAIFRNHLKNVIELSKKYVSYFPTSDHPYDVLLDAYERGITTEDVKNIFDELRPNQVELIDAIRQKQQVQDDFLLLNYDENLMWRFSEKIATSFGYDWRRGRQDSTVHPFSQAMGPDDVRITSKWVPQSPFSLLFGTMHETGHALYDQGVGHSWSRTMLEGGASFALHESQSRLWENLVGRSFAFWEYFFPLLQQTFPTQLGNVKLENFYRAINKVQPSLIRIEADEATYNLHIMLRFELEVALIEGSVDVDQLPEMWKAKMKEYLGIVPLNVSMGVLQDIHWSSGLMGYFPTYALGNLISVQLWEKFKNLNPDLEDQMRKGDFSSLLSWLRVKIHQYGRKYEPQELIKRVTKSKINPKPYLHYLNSKYGSIYDL